MSHCHSFQLQLPPEVDAKTWSQYAIFLRSIADSLGGQQDEYGEKITDLRAFQSSFAWTIGDWMVAGRRIGIKPKKLKQQLDFVLERVPKKYTSRVLDNITYTAAAFETARRRAEISIWFHCEIAKRKFPRELEDKALRDAAGDIPGRPDRGPMKMGELKDYLDHTAEIYLHQRPELKHKLTFELDSKSHSILVVVSKHLWGTSRPGQAMLWACQQYLHEHGSELGLQEPVPAPPLPATSSHVGK